MKQSIWIHSRSNMWWTNGYSIVTDEVARAKDIRWIQDYLYRISGIILCKDTFVPFDWKPRVEMPRRTPEEVLRILDNKNDPWHPELPV